MGAKDNMSGTRMNAETRFYGVIGDPVKHSKSPVMLNAAFAAVGINAVYGAFHIKSTELRQAVNGFRALGFGGINVTIPHKLAIMEYIDEIDEGAKVIGAVNTVVHEDGKLIGYNTDGIGYVRALKEENRVSLAGSRILVIGAGGAARGVVYALAQEKPKQIWIANRTAAKAEQLADSLNEFASVTGMALQEIKEVIGDADVVINTTAVGMHPYIEEMPFQPDLLKGNTLVSDLIYNPLTTKLLAEAKQKGCRIHGGLGMFVYQGAYAFEYWTGRQAPVDIMRQTVLNSF